MTAYPNAHYRPLGEIRRVKSPAGDVMSPRVEARKLPEVERSRACDQCVTLAVRAGASAAIASLLPAAVFELPSGRRVCFRHIRDVFSWDVRGVVSSLAADEYFAGCSVARRELAAA